MLFPSFVDKVRNDVDGDREDDRGVLLVADGAQGLSFLKKFLYTFFVGNGGGNCNFVFIVCIPGDTSAAGLRLSSPALPPPPSDA